MTEQQIEDTPEFYESEKLAAEVVCRSTRQKYVGKGSFGDSAVQQRFANEVQGKCAEQGLVVEIDFEWDDPESGDFSPTVADDPSDNNIYYMPRVRVVGRVDKVKEYDHDRQAFEVKAGEYDGIKGVVDMNTGFLKEDAKKKVIY